MAKATILLGLLPTGIGGKSLYIKKEWIKAVYNTSGNIIGDGTITDSYDSKYISDWEVYTEADSAEFTRCYKDTVTAGHDNKRLMMFKHRRSNNKAEDDAGTYYNTWTDDIMAEYFMFHIRVQIAGIWYDNIGEHVNTGHYFAAINPPNISISRLSNVQNVPVYNLRDIEINSVLNPYASHKPDDATPNSMGEWIGYAKSQKGNLTIDGPTAMTIPFNEAHDIKMQGYRYPVATLDVSNVDFKLFDGSTVIESILGIDYNSVDWKELIHSYLNTNYLSVNVNKTLVAKLMNGSTEIVTRSIALTLEKIPFTIYITAKTINTGVSPDTITISFRAEHELTYNTTFEFSFSIYDHIAIGFSDWESYDNNTKIISLAPNTLSQEITHNYTLPDNLSSYPSTPPELDWRLKVRVTENAPGDFGPSEFIVARTSKQFLPIDQTVSGETDYGDFETWIYQTP